jgi:hypothetical protein
MALTMTPIGVAGKTRLPVEQISPDTIQAVDEALEWCGLNPGRLEVKFADQDAADTFLKEARSYAYVREAGRVVVVGNSTQKGAARFRIEPYTAPTSTQDPPDVTT